MNKQAQSRAIALLAAAAGVLLASSDLLRAAATNAPAPEPLSLLDPMESLGLSSLPEPADLPRLDRQGPTLRLQDVLDRIQRGDAAGALDLARQAAAADPTSPAAAELAGVAAAKLGRLEEALTWFERAVTLNPDQSTAITKMGDIRAAQGDTEAARAAYQRALALDPGDRRAHQRLGLILEQEGDKAGAVDHFERGLAGTPPDYVGIKVNLGRLYNERNEFQRTIDLLEPVVTPAYRGATAHLVLGTAYLGRGRSAEALAALGRMASLEPDSADAPLALAIAHRTAGSPDQALAYAEQALQRQPGLPAALVQRAEARLALGQTNQAMADLAQALVKATRPEPIHCRIADLWSRQGDAAKAVAAYRAALAAGKPPAPTTYDRLASVHQGRGEFASAEGVLLQACQTYPRSGYLRFRLGLLYGYFQEYSRAREALLEANRLVPDDPRVHKALAGVCLRLGDRAQAIAWTERRLKLVPDSLEDRFLLGGLLEENGKSEAAMLEYRKVLELDPGHVGALNNLASILTAQGRPGDALAPAELAVKRAPESATVLDTYGWALFRAGRREEARRVLEKAVAGTDARPAHCYHLAVVLQASGETDAARGLIRRALADPGAAFPERADAERLAAALR